MTESVAVVMTDEQLLVLGRVAAVVGMSIEEFLVDSAFKVAVRVQATIDMSIAAATACTCSPRWRGPTNEYTHESTCPLSRISGSRT